MNTSQATHDRLKAMQRSEERAADMAKRVKEQAEKPRTNDERVRDATAAQISELQQKLKSGLLLPAEREQLRRRLEILKQGHARVDATIKEDKRIEKFRSDHAFQNAKSHFEGFSKNPAAPVSAEDIALCGAILDSSEWESPADAVKAYWGEVERVEQAAYQQASKVAADKHHDSLRAEHESAAAKVAALERGQAMTQARANLGAADEA